MIPENEAKELITEKKQETDGKLDTEAIVALMRQACAITEARNADKGIHKGISRAINILARHRDALLEKDAQRSDFDMSGMDKDEVEANFMQVAIQTIKKG